MRYSRYAALLLLLSLTACLQQARQDLAQCTAQANARYPATSQIPQGQPFKDIYGCMWNQGYDLETRLHQCTGSDYTAVIVDAACYRPRNIVTGYFYDLSYVGHY